MKSNLQSQARLAAVRPQVARLTREVMDVKERDQLLASILSVEHAEVTPIPRGTRFQRRLPILAAATATALVLALIFLLLPGTSGNRGDAYALARATAALSQTENVVLYTSEVERSPQGSGTYISGWYDLGGSKEWRVVGYDANGDVVSQFGVTEDNGTLRFEDMQYGPRTVMVGPVPPSITSAQRSGHFPVSSPVDVRKTIQTDLNGGKAISAGRQVVDGFHTVHFVEQNPDKGTKRLDIWIEATTYRVVRLQEMSVNHYLIVADFHWLPRNADTLANLTFDIPSGFATIPAPSLPPDLRKR